MSVLPALSIQPTPTRSPTPLPSQHRAGSDDESDARPQRGAPRDPDQSFDDIMRKASEMKAAQMKDKRRAWEASPEFMKNTMTFDKDESYVKMRESASVAEKIARSTCAPASSVRYFIFLQYAE